MNQPQVIRKRLSPMVVSKQLNQAKTDLVEFQLHYKWITTVPVKIDENEFTFFMRRWPVEFTEHFTYADAYEEWKVELEKWIKYIENYIRETESWLQSKMGKPFRSSLPKKKQRELGMLPPV